MSPSRVNQGKYLPQGLRKYLETSLEVLTVRTRDWEMLERICRQSPVILVMKLDKECVSRKGIGDSPGCYGP